MREMTLFQSGIEDFLDGKTYGDNPYPSGSIEGFWWEHGWLSGYSLPSAPIPELDIRDHYRRQDCPKKIF